MTKDTFRVLYDQESGLKYVSKVVDELTKNHRENDKGDGGDGYMPEMLGNPMCPVLSFEKLLEKLNPKCDRLWQRPKASYLPEESCWYTNSSIGEKNMQKFMSSLSEKCQLSKRYANHSIRATGATILSHQRFNPAQIMSVSGHKSVSSLSIYQHIGSSEKISKGKAIGEHLNNKHTTKNNTCNYSSVNTEFNDFLLDDMDFTDFNATELMVSLTTTKLPIAFNNCSFSNVTININNK